MIPFTEWIKVNNLLTEFNFRKVQSPNQDKFFITVVESGRDNISFDMTMSPRGQWNIVRPAPEYIVGLKEKLVETIEKHCTLNLIPFFNIASLPA